jgi:cold-inducible RNA-binding protein
MQSCPILSTNNSEDLFQPFRYSQGGWFDDRASRLRDKSKRFSLLLFSLAHPSTWSESPDSFTLTLKAKERVDRPTSLRKKNMSKKLYVGNLGLGVNESDLQQMFSVHGSILSAKVIMDRDTDQSRGFGFVEMSTDDEAQAAMSALDGKDHGGRVLKVNEAKSKVRTASAGTVPMAGIANAPW